MLGQEKKSIGGVLVAETQVWLESSADSVWLIFDDSTNTTAALLLVVADPLKVFQLAVSVEVWVVPVTLVPELREKRSVSRISEIFKIMCREQSEDSKCDNGTYGPSLARKNLYALSWRRREVKFPSVQRWCVSRVSQKTSAGGKEKSQIHMRERPIRRVAQQKGRLTLKVCRDFPVQLYLVRCADIEGFTVGVPAHDIRVSGRDVVYHGEEELGKVRSFFEAQGIRLLALGRRTLDSRSFLVDRLRRKLRRRHHCVVVLLDSKGDGRRCCR